MNITRLLAVSLAHLTLTSFSYAAFTASLVSSATLPSQYVIGPSSVPISTYRFVSDDRFTALTELRFSFEGNNTVSFITLYSGGIEIGSGSVINNTADIITSNVTVPQGSSGTNITIVPTYSTVNFITGIPSNRPSTISLSFIKAVHDFGLIETSNVSLASNTMTLVSTRPSLAISGSNAGLINGTIELAEFTVAADANGPLKIENLPLLITTSGSVTLPLQSLVVKDSANSIITGASANLPAIGANSVGTANIMFASGYQLAAGTSQTFKIFGDASTAFGLGVNQITTSLGSSSSFIWDDINGNASGLTGTLILGASYPISSVSVSNVSTPEPGAAALIGSGAVFFLGRRSRR